MTDLRARTNVSAATQIVVGMSDFKVSRDPDSLIVTYALGSCIAVMVYDPGLRCGGMIHYMLPLSSVSPQKAEAEPAMFGDTGVPLLFGAMYELGCQKKNLVVKVAGGGSLFDDHGAFNIGQRNHTVLRKLFWKNNIVIAAEDVGGNRSRTVKFRLSDGRVVVHSQGEEWEL